MACRTQKTSNSVLLCSVSPFRWLCLRLLWLPRVCDINRPVFNKHTNVKWTIETEGGKHWLPAFWTRFLVKYHPQSHLKKPAPTDQLTLWMWTGVSAYSCYGKSDTLSVPQSVKSSSLIGWRMVTKVADLHFIMTVSSLQLWITV